MNKYSITQKIRFRILEDFKTNLWETTPRKMVLYWSTKLGILKLRTNLESFRRIDLGYWQTSKQIYRKLQYKEKVSGEFEALSPFSRRIVLYSLTKFRILKPWTNIAWPKRFEFGFSQTSKQIYRKLQYKQKSFGEFQGLSRFPRKMVLYSSTKFGIPKFWTNIS